MLQQVDFYVLEGTNETARLAFACRIAEKAFHQGMSVYLKTANAAQIDELDELLWSFSDTSFLPHSRLDSSEKTSTRILLGEMDPPEECNQLLISLTDTVPDSALQFSRVADLIGDDNRQKQEGRNRFRQYREYGIEPTTHKIRAQRN